MKRPVKRTAVWYSYDRATNKWTNHGLITCEVCGDVGYKNYKYWKRVDTGEDGFTYERGSFRKDI